MALCDPDPAQIEKARADALNPGGEATKDAKAYDDYRKLLDNAASFDAVLIATPDHWHAPLCKAFMKLGKHVYCEKPLTHSVAEARELRELARSSKVVTQMGNQGSASASLRRCTRSSRPARWARSARSTSGASASRQRRQRPGRRSRPGGLQLGPVGRAVGHAPLQEKRLSSLRWRGWFDFGNGGLADFCCHAINLPMRALDLGYPERLVVNMKDGKQTPGKPALEFHFPARGNLVPLTFYWQGDGKPPAAVIQPLVDVYKDKMPGGIMIVGEKGCIYTNHWNTGGLIRLEGEPRLKDVLHHAATKDIPESLPRSKGHGQEWIDACRGEGKTFSDFDIGGKLTEIGLAGVVAIRTGKSLDWDGEKMQATNAPEAARFVRTEYRTKWLI